MEEPRIINAVNIFLIFFILTNDLEEFFSLSVEEEEEEKKLFKIKRRCEGFGEKCINLSKEKVLSSKSSENTTVGSTISDLRDGAVEGRGDGGGIAVVGRGGRGHHRLERRRRIVLRRREASGPGGRGGVRRRNLLSVGRGKPGAISVRRGQIAYATTNRS